MIAAAQGDRVLVGELLEQFRKDRPQDDFWGDSYYAWAGDRDEANRRAARVDQYSFGSPALVTMLLWCRCGAPWDLSATPHFAADIEESGLPWPPVSPIHFPLKNW
jgi:hypothetical protein